MILPFMTADETKKIKTMEDATKHLNKKKTNFIPFLLEKSIL